MSQEIASDSSLPGILVDRGWVQGAVFQAPSVCVAINRFTDATATGPEFEIQRRPTGPAESFVVVSQTCDIKAMLQTEPLIEAIICAVEPDASRRATLSKSARWFEIDPSTGLVAHAMWRVQIAKQALLPISPTPWPGSSIRLQRFTRWLGHRYDRPAIPEPVVYHFQNPIEKYLDRIRKKNRSLFLLFNESVEEIRISMPENDVYPLVIDVVLLLKEGGVSLDQANAISSVMQEVVGELDPAAVRIDEYYLRTREQISMAEYFATRPIYCEALSYLGDETIGAVPPPKV